MSTDEKQQEGQPDEAAQEKAGAFTKDKKFGNRLDQMVALDEPFLLLGAVADEPIETAYGMSETAKLLIQKLNKDSGGPVGPPIKCVTVLSAVVEKVLALTEEEVKAGPVVKLHVVPAKSRGGKPVTVLSWIRNLGDADDFSEFGIDPNEVSGITDLARPVGERIPY